MNNYNSNLPLPQDLIAEILLRLPIKSLVRFRCVSKSWLALISNPNFAKSHYELTASPSQRFLSITYFGPEVRSLNLDASLHDNSATIEFNYTLPMPPIGFKIRGSCRGFVLLDNYPYLFLWNPSTTALKQLSYSAMSSKNYYNIYEFTLLYGFGYDASTDDYLVVMASIDYSSDVANVIIHFELFSMRTNSWERKIEGAHFPYGKPRDESGLLFNGAIHWFVFRDDDESAGVIIAFDLIEKNLSEVPLPEGHFAAENHFDLRVIGGCLGLCYRSDFPEVWIMKEYKVQSSWTKYVDVPVDPTNHFTPVYLTKGGEIVGLEDGELVKLNDKGEFLERGSNCYVGLTAMYTESLLSLPTDDGDDGEAGDDDEQ